MADRRPGERVNLPDRGSGTILATTERPPGSGYVLVRFDRYQRTGHLHDPARQCCTCGFGYWSAEHVAVMAYREAADTAPPA